MSRASKLRRAERRKAAAKQAISPPNEQNQGGGGQSARDLVLVGKAIRHHYPIEEDCRKELVEQARATMVGAALQDGKIDYRARMRGADTILRADMANIKLDIHEGNSREFQDRVQRLEVEAQAVRNQETPAPQVNVQVNIGEQFLERARRYESIANQLAESGPGLPVDPPQAPPQAGTVPTNNRA